MNWNLSLSREDYAATQAWREAKLDCCPERPGGGCGFVRNGTCRRRTRCGDARIPRRHCPDAHKTWPLLPGCFAAQLLGTPDDLEAAAPCRKDVSIRLPPSPMSAACSLYAILAFQKHPS